MKSIIAVDIVILIAIAVIVISVAVIFFKTSAIRGGSKLELQMQRVELCKQYVMIDKNCDGNIDKKDGNIKSELINICKRLGGYLCEREDKKCIQSCCAEFCQSE